MFPADKLGKINTFTFELAILENGNFSFINSLFKAKLACNSPSTIKSGCSLCKIPTASLTFLGGSKSVEPKLAKESMAILGLIFKRSTDFAVSIAISAKSLAVGFTLMVVSAKNTGPVLVIKIYIPAILLTPSSVPITCKAGRRSEEHTSELQSRPHLVCRLLLVIKNQKNIYTNFLKHTITY